MLRRLAPTSPGPNVPETGHWLRLPGAQQSRMTVVIQPGY